MKKLITILIMATLIILCGSLIVVEKFDRNDNQFIIIENSSFITFDNMTFSNISFDFAVHDVYRLGIEYTTNLSVVLSKNVKAYINEQYLKHYPNEVGLCLLGYEKDNKFFLHTKADSVIYNNSDMHVTFNCVGNYTNYTVGVHSHTALERVSGHCYPSDFDVKHATFEYNLLVCGNNETITDVLIYMRAGTNSSFLERFKYN